MDDHLPLGMRLNNPGNIRFNGIQWMGLANPQETGGFCHFLNPVFGLRAMMMILRHYDLHTICELIQRWAPPSDHNPTDSYIRYVANHAGKGNGDHVDMANRQDAIPIVRSMCQFEQGPPILGSDILSDKNLNLAADKASLNNGAIA